MSREHALHVLDGSATGMAFGLAWVTDDALARFGGRAGSPDPASDLVAAALDLGLDFAFVPAQEPWASRCAQELHDHDVAVMWAVPGPLGLVAARLGWSAVLRQSAAAPESLAVSLAEALRDAAEHVRAGAAVQADAIVLADDLATGTGWLISPDFALSAIVPCAAHIAAEARAHDMPVCFHSDGDFRAIMGALGAAGFTGVHVAVAPLESLEAVSREASAHDLRLFGGLSSGALLDDSWHGAARWLSSTSVDRGMMVCDDGGITTAEQLAVLKDAHAALRASGEGGRGIG